MAGVPDSTKARPEGCGRDAMLDGTEEIEYDTKNV
jgi:hypothetical protein